MHAKHASEQNYLKNVSVHTGRITETETDRFILITGLLLKGFSLYKLSRRNRHLLLNSKKVISYLASKYLIKINK